jgi:hypothetical protein
MRISDAHHGFILTTSDALKATCYLSKPFSESAAQIQARRLHRVPLHRIPVLRI